MPNKTNRRNFLKSLSGAGAALSAGQVLALSPESIPPAPAGAKYMGGFIAPKLDKVKVAIIGCGARGGTHYNHVSSFEHTKFVGICDLYENNCERAKQMVLKNNPEAHKNVKTYFGDKHAYRKMLSETKPDIVWIATPWEWHTPMCIDVMKAGAHAMTEVPMATSIEETWQLINTSEETQRHCMMLENVNYGREELMFLNMARQGVFGEILHGEASYIHELRNKMRHFEKGRGSGSWRTLHWANENGNLYSTHGLGPVAQYMNIARTEDTFRRLVSFSSPAQNRALYAKEVLGENSKSAKLEFKGGDINTSIIKTTLGRTIMVQWDVSSPRPYDRKNLIQGTRGTGAGFPNRIALDYTWKNATPELRKVLGLEKQGKNSHSNHHNWRQDEMFQAFYEVYDHPLYTRMKEVAKRLGGHGGMDAIMNYRIIECLRNGQPLDQNIYEGALWSVVTPLSRKSVAEDGMPQDFPDFTRGRWNDTAPLGIVQ